MGDRVSADVDFYVHIPNGSLFKNLITHFATEEANIPITINKHGLFINLIKRDDKYEMFHHVWLDPDEMIAFYVEEDYDEKIVLDFGKFAKDLKTLQKTDGLIIRKKSGQNTILDILIPKGNQNVGATVTLDILNGEITPNFYDVPSLEDETYNKVIGSECMETAKVTISKNAFIEMAHTVTGSASKIILKTKHGSASSKIYRSKQFETHCSTECKTTINCATAKILSRIATITNDPKAIIKFYFDISNQIVICIPIATYGKYIIILEKETL